MENLRALRDQIVVTFLDTMELKDPSLRRHCERVSTYAMKLCDAMDMSEERGDAVRTAALLHDIGKICIAENQRETLGQHVNHGVHILEPIIAGFPPGLNEAILCHHERMDGTGYPRGISGDEIPLEAQMIAIADRYDNLTAPDQEACALSPSEALQRMRMDCPANYDITLVEKFAESIDDEPNQAPQLTRRSPEKKHQGRGSK